MKDDNQSDQVKSLVKSARALARERHHATLRAEHVIIVLARQPDFVKLIDGACGANGTAATLALNIEEILTALPPPTLAAGNEPTEDASFQQLVRYARLRVKSTEERTSLNDVVLSLHSLKETRIPEVLERLGIRRFAIINQITHGVSSEFQQRAAAAGDVGEDTSIATSMLEAFCVNLNEVVTSTDWDPVIGRDAEIERALDVLCRRTKHNPLFVGEPGVGKTAIVEGIARRIVDHNVPRKLLGYQIFSLNLGDMIAGAKYRGDFEDRMKRLLAEINKPGCKAMLFIDEMHTIIGAGNTQGGLDASNLLKPALASRGNFRCIGATTWDEAFKYFDKDRAMSRRFQKIELGAPSEAEAEAILTGIAASYESHHEVAYAKDALRAAVQLAVKHVADRQLPDSAIDIMDEAGAAAHSNGRLPWPVITVSAMEEATARISKTPVGRIRKSESLSLRNLAAELKQRIFGQDEAIDAVVASIKISRAGLRDSEKPIASYILDGPTGVGKSKLAKELADLLGIELLRFDMSEYMEKHTVARLIGAPPGYQGADDGGLLTGSVHKHPHCVLLLDECDKANEDIFNILLQVCDGARLSGSNGRPVDFRNVILLLTTNSGAADCLKEDIGFTKQERGDPTAAVRKFFRTEFINKTDGVLSFGPLRPAIMDLIVDEEITRIEIMLEQQGISLEVDKHARAWLAKHGYSRKDGARPLSRLVSSTIKTPVSDEIIDGSLSTGGIAKVSVENGKIRVECTPPQSRRQKSTGASARTPVHQAA